VLPPPVSCCLKCHFRWEEINVLPYLPPELADQLLREHAAIERCKMLKSLVDDHAERELVMFRRYCPPELVAQVESDHAHLDGSGPCKCAA
jgi:hypothetical protein